MVSRAGLQTAPAPLSAPARPAVPASRPDAAQAQAAVRTAQNCVDQARQSIQTANRGQLNDLLRTAQRDVDKARRTPGARRELRELETKFEQLKREIGQREEAIDSEAHRDRTRQTQLTSPPVDRLAPMNLGMRPQGFAPAAPPSAPDPAPDVIHVVSGSKGAWNELLRTPPPNATIVVDELFVYETDGHGRTVRAQTVIGQVVHKEFRESMQKWLRNSTDQRSAGGDDRRYGGDGRSVDHGGHLFGTLFGGPGEAININAMHRSINTGSYRRLEILWEKVDQYGGAVDVAVDFHFEGASKRADSFTVTYNMGDGDPVSISFDQ